MRIRARWCDASLRNCSAKWGTMLCPHTHMVNLYGRALPEQLAVHDGLRPPQLIEHALIAALADALLLLVC